MHEKNINSKLNTIDLFAGCGGLTDGFEQTDFYNTLACVEWEKMPCLTLSKRLKEKWSSDSEKAVIRFDIQRIEELFNGWHNDLNFGTHEGLSNIISDKKNKISSVKAQLIKN